MPEDEKRGSEESYAATTVAEFIRRVDESYAGWSGLVSQFDEEFALRPVHGDWAVKDIVAHVTWYEREMIGVLRDRALAGSDLWEQPNTERNAAIHALHRERSWRDIRDESQRVHAEVRALLSGLRDEELVNPAAFAEMPPDWMPVQVLASNTYEHYEAHLRDLQALAAADAP